MDQQHAHPEPALARALLGYLNLSDGRPASRWQKQLNDAFVALAESGAARPWDALLAGLRQRLAELHASDKSAFGEIGRADFALRLASEVLPAYRQHHADLLAHVSEAELFGPFFLARLFEAVLQLRSRTEAPRPRDVIARLNDFIGHRPIALLETRPAGEPYEHERHRPLPLYLRNVGAAHGRYRAVLEKTLEILRETDAQLLSEASFGFDQLDEIALDLRAYDHGHPVNRRPNYVFGEWDPHQIDNKGRYSRYMIRKVTFDALLERVTSTTQLDPEESLVEGAAVLAGTILMATGVSGWGPGAIDSTTNLASLLPRIARYRDAFYEQLLQRVQPDHAARLRREREMTRQPFGAARQHLNAHLARGRALQMQQRCLALLFAEMGYPEASRREASRIVSVSVRFLSTILGRLTTASVECERGQLREAAARLPEVEGLLHKGIACGAFADPWNVLGFQGLFPLTATGGREDAIRDGRLDELMQVMEQTFGLYALLLSEAAANGESESLVKEQTAGMERLATWWDRFATYEVSDLRRVHGGEAVQSARKVSAALSAWHARGEVTADLSFWRRRLDEFNSPRAFALVVEALLKKGDFKAALGLLGSWLSQAEQVPLEDAGHSFHSLALRWLLSFTTRSETSKPGTRETPIDTNLVVTFFDHLETNANEYWDPPSLEERYTEEEEEDDPFEAAYENMTYRDSTDDREGAVSDGEVQEGDFDLESQSDLLEKRLRFLSTIGRLWQVAARRLGRQNVREGAGPSHLVPIQPLEGWLTIARRNRLRLLELLDALHEHSLPEPSGDHDSLVEYDRRRGVKEHLTQTAISACLDTSLAVTALRGALDDHDEEPSADEDPALLAPVWGPALVRLERALFAGEAETARVELGLFIDRFRGEPLLFTSHWARGTEKPAEADPRQTLRVRTAQAVLRAMLANLPRLGLFYETHDLLRTARSMEQAQWTRGRGVTEFNHFFQSAYQAVVENLIRSAADWPPEEGSDEQIVDMLERLTAPFLALWIEHSRTLQLSVLESVNETDWRTLREFVQRYGSDLFHARFLTLGNLRGILHRGVDSHLTYLVENADPIKPMRLVEELGTTIRREDAVKRLEVVLQAVVENYEEYKDYNTTTTQSDYGENLHVLLDFVRLKANYERHAWQFKPLVMAHEVLARHGRASTALRWQESLVHYTRDLARQHVEQLARLERQHGVKLGTVGDRIAERFVKTLALDRLCALIEPCLKEARSADAQMVPEDRPAFGRLQEELKAYTALPTGVGLDVPAWLRKLEAEVQKAESKRGEVGMLTESFFRIPCRGLQPEDVKEQLLRWDPPANPDKPTR